VIGVEQIGLNVSFLTNITVVVIGILLAGAAGAFSIGARNMMANILGALHTRKHCHIGEQLSIGGHQGEVLDVTQTSIILDTQNGKVVIPAKLFDEQISLVGSALTATRSPNEQNEGKGDE